MSSSPQPQQKHRLWRELTVPGVMLVAIALFVCDSMHLSYEALVFPSVLIIVVLAALAWALVVYLKGEGRRRARTTTRAARSSPRRRGCWSPCRPSSSLRSTISAC